MKRWILPGAAVLAVVAVGAVALWWGQRPKGDEEESQRRSVAVEWASLAEEMRLAGVLTFGEPTDLRGSGGVLTKAPQAGATLNPGDVVMEVDGAPVFMLVGDAPVWRVVGPGVVGPDVAALRQQLAEVGIPAGGAGETAFDTTLATAIGALYEKAGYDPPHRHEAAVAAIAEAEEKFRAARAVYKEAKVALEIAKKPTATRADILAADQAIAEAQNQWATLRHDNADQAAIRAAEIAINVAIAQRALLDDPPDTRAEQAALAAARTDRDVAKRQLADSQLDTLDPAAVLIVPSAPIRLDTITLKVGDPTDEPVARWTGTVLTARADISESQRTMVEEGQAVTIKLADSQEVVGTVEEVTAAHEDPDTGSIIPARVIATIEDQATVAAIGPSAVSISLVEPSAEQSLVVPVTALLALAEGGYAVEREAGGLVGVEVGVVTDTRAQIFSDALEAGEKVLVP
jgi:hypothetical protein